MLGLGVANCEVAHLEVTDPADNCEVAHLEVTDPAKWQVFFSAWLRHLIAYSQRQGDCMLGTFAGGMG